MEEKVFESCIAQIIKKDQDSQNALRQIYDAYHGYVFHLCLSILNHREDAEDVASDFFIRLWQKADTYVPGNGHRAWIGRIVHNMSIDYLRKKQKQQNQISIEEQTEIEDPGAMNQVEENMQVTQILSTLPQDQREVVHLKVFGELTIDQISKILNIPVTTAAWRYRQGIKNLRKTIAK